GVPERHPGRGTAVRLLHGAALPYGYLAAPGRSNERPAPFFKALSGPDAETEALESPRACPEKSGFHGPTDSAEAEAVRHRCAVLCRWPTAPPASGPTPYEVPRCQETDSP